jgi:NADH:ubiquinone oxidoreductase subunit K
MAISVEDLVLYLCSLYLFTSTVLNMVISVEVLVLCLFSLYLFTSTGLKHDFIGWGSCFMLVFFVFIYAYWSKPWLYQLRILFYICVLCICLRLPVLNMVISVEVLVLCLFSLYLFTSTGLKHGYISWGSCFMLVFFVFIYVYWS